MQPTATRRPRVAPAATAAPAVGLVVPVLPVLRFVLANGVLEIEDVATARALLENEQRQRLAAEAEQAALSVVYRLGGEPDESRPYGGLLTRRLDISQRSAEQLLRDGKLRFTCAGKKNYRVSERAVREYLGDMPPT